MIANITANYIALKSHLLAINYSVKHSTIFTYFNIKLNKNTIN